jgi:drug/metabolite transporter (DMT)-like permease
MLALAFGILAAVSWAVHDLMVRRLTQGGAVLPLVLIVAASAVAVLLVPSLVLGDWSRMDARAVRISGAAGVTYVAGMMGLYMALKLAPVRLVAPVLGAYPMITLGLAAAQGRAVTGLEWAAVAAIVGGVAIVAMVSDERREGEGSLVPAMIWATFALGQEAARSGSELPAILVTRIAGLAVIAVLALVARAPVSEARGSFRTLCLMGVLDALALGLVLASARLPNPEYAAISSSLFGVLTILLAWRFLSERVRPAQWGGIVVVFAGIAVLSAQG